MRRIWRGLEIFSERDVMCARQLVHSDGVLCEHHLKKLRRHTVAQPHDIFLLFLL
jgi:hypothetical protein